MIHFLTMALGGEGYLNFMGNEVSTLAKFAAIVFFIGEEILNI